MRAGGKLRLVSMLLAAVLIVNLISGCGVSASAETAVTAGSEAVEYVPKQNLETILVMGIDRFERIEEKHAYVNNMQCDFLLLVVLDKDNQKMDLIHLNRDTMAKINKIGVFGGAVGSFTGQLALAHAYGSGGSDSALNAVRAVSNFMKGIKIDHYMTFTMESVPIVNDAVGGVTVTVEDDFSEVDPTLVMGQQITLMGEHALKFVRGRHYVADSTNLNRMARQRQYMSALYGKIMEASEADPDFVQKLIFKMGDAFETDCTITQLQNLFDTAKDCEMTPFITIAGEAVLGETFMEFYADPDSLDQVIQDVFYAPAK